MSRTQIGLFQVILSATTFAFSSVIAKWAFARGLTPFSFSLGTSLITAMVMAGWLRGGRWRPPAGVRPLALLLHGLTGGASGLLFVLALAYLDVSLATLLVFTYPVVVAAGAWLVFGQRLTTRQIIAVVLTLAGTFLTAGPVQGGAPVLGVLLALSTTVTHAIYILLGEHVLTQWDPKAATVFTRLVNGLLAVALVPAAAPALLHLTGFDWVFLVFATVAGVIAPFLFLLEGLARVGASRAAIVSTAELPIALLLGWLFMGDRLTPGQGGGAVLITLAVVLIQWPQR